MARKAFNFYRSYFDVANELPDQDRLAFYDALISYQFTGVKPNLKGMALFAFLSQKHSIESQVVGYMARLNRSDINKSNENISFESLDIIGAAGGAAGGAAQEKEKEKEKEENIDFFVFWNMYDKKADKAVCIKKWEKLSLKEKKQILLHVPKYVKATPDIKFRKNPSTYLNQKTWLDEIEDEKPVTSEQTMQQRILLNLEKQINNE
jgi:ribosomal protein L7/L12